VSCKSYLGLYFLKLSGILLKLYWSARPADCDQVLSKFRTFCQNSSPYLANLLNVNSVGFMSLVLLLNSHSISKVTAVVSTHQQGQISYIF